MPMRFPSAMTYTCWVKISDIERVSVLKPVLNENNEQSPVPHFEGASPMQFRQYFRITSGLDIPAGVLPIRIGQRAHSFSNVQSLMEA